MRAFRMLAVIVTTALGIAGCLSIADAKAQEHPLCYGVCCAGSRFYRLCDVIVHIFPGYSVPSIASPTPPDLFWPEATSMVNNQFAFPMRICTTSTLTGSSLYLVVQANVGNQGSGGAGPYQVKADVRNYNGNPTDPPIGSATRSLTSLAAGSTTQPVIFQFDGQTDQPPIGVTPSPGMMVPGSRFLVTLTITDNFLPLEQDVANNTALGYCGF